MSRIKHPGQKKRLSLSRDHRVHARHDKNFRSEWPLKKARTNRKFRHAGKAALAAGVADEASDVPLDNAHVPLKRQRSLRKTDVQSLADWIADRRKYREWSNPKDPNDERRVRFVPDGRTAIALVRIIWQAMRPESDYGEAYWRNFRARVSVSNWIVWKPRSRAEFSVSRIDAHQFWCVDGGYIPPWNDEIRMEMVPDGKTAISLARVVWQAHHPSPRRNDEYWQRAFRAMPNKGVWVVKERSGRRTFRIAKRDGQFMDTSFATAARALNAVG